MKANKHLNRMEKLNFDYLKLSYNYFIFKISQKQVTEKDVINPF